MHSSEAWDATAEEYDAGLVRAVHFMPKYAKDLFHYALTGNPNSEEKDVVEAINTLSSVKIIDIAAGSGSLTLQMGKYLSKSKNASAHILGTDFSPKMVEILEKHVKEENLQTFIDCKIMDGQVIVSFLFSLEKALELSSDSLDFAFSVFGVSLFPQPLKGISEIHRVLKKGGTIGLASWTANQTMFNLHLEALQKVVGPTSSQKPGTIHMSGSCFDKEGALGTKEEMTEALKSCGFENIQIVAKTHDAEFGNSEKYLRALQNNPVLGQLKQKLGEDSWKTYTQEIERLFQEKYPNYSLPCEALLAVASKPRLLAE